MKFVEAYKRLEEIYQYFQSSEFIAIDDILAMQKEAEKLHTICQEKLLKTYKDLDHNANDEE